jgi:hypothetical protein
MGMAAAMSAIVWRMLRTERQRSSARVEALTALTADAPAKAEPQPRIDIDLPMRESAGATTPAMFVEREPASAWGPRFAVMGAVALILTSVVLFSLAARGQKAAPARKTSAATATPVAASAAAGLELLSLRDSREPGNAASKPAGLTITGLVRNPREGSALTRVTVTAYTFDATGAFLASGRALIDVTALAPGDESPFVVTVPVSDSVARYRIGFRDDAGRVIAHVDRRQQSPVAANW